MELSREIIIDTLFNVAGYVTAGAFWLVIYAIFINRSRQSAAVTTPQAVARETESRPAPATARRTEFVSLAANASTRDADLEERDRLRAEATRYQRNRAEVIRIARDMLKSGTQREKIRSLLPISEGELALLANE